MHVRRTFLLDVLRLGGRVVKVELLGGDMEEDGNLELQVTVTRPPKLKDQMLMDLVKEFQETTKESE